MCVDPPPPRSRLPTSPLTPSFAQSANYPLNPDGTPVGGLAPARPADGAATAPAELPKVDGVSGDEQHASPQGDAAAGPSSSTTSPNLSLDTSPHLQQSSYAQPQQQQYVEAGTSGATHTPPLPPSTSAPSSSQVFTSYPTPQTAYPTSLPVANGSPVASSFPAFQPESSASNAAASGLFPSAEDYGVSASHFRQQHVDGLQPQPHLRSYSEGGHYGGGQDRPQQQPLTDSGEGERASGGDHGDESAPQRQYAKEESHSQQPQQQNGQDQQDQRDDADAA